jgi:hypothetical protein
VPLTIVAQNFNQQIKSIKVYRMLYLKKETINSKAGNEKLFQNDFMPVATSNDFPGDDDDDDDIDEDEDDELDEIEIELEEEDPEEDPDDDSKAVIEEDDLIIDDDDEEDDDDI